MRWLLRLGSLKVSVFLLLLLFVSVFAGTLAQAAWGASAVQTTFFGRVWFEVEGFWLPGLPLLLAFTGLNLAIGAWVHLERSVRNIGLWGVHLSLVLFCLGSLGFSLGQQDLILGLTLGGASDHAYLRDSSTGETRPLPFVLTLDDFRIETYPGGTEPSDYFSKVRARSGGVEVAAEIRMNQPFRRDGWTIYQSSVNVVDGQPSPVYKLMNNPWAPFPYLVSGLLGVSLALHFLLRRRRGVVSA